MSGLVEEGLRSSGLGEGTASLPLAGPEATPHLSVEGFDGPLDFLLDMVRRQRIDLARLPIGHLIEQFASALSQHAGRVPLERRGAWLVMASQLVLLKSQLLMPASPDQAARAEEEASRRLAQIAELARMHGAAEWLAARPQLGRDVFARAAPEQPVRPRSENLLAFLEATLVMLEGREKPDVAAVQSYRPEPLDLWRVPDALARLRSMLRLQEGRRPMGDYLPHIAEGDPARRIKRRAAFASTLIASLELAREGEAEIHQDGSFGAIALSAAAPAGGITPGSAGPVSSG